MRRTSSSLPERRCPRRKKVAGTSAEPVRPEGGRGGRPGPVVKGEGYHRHLWPGLHLHLRAAGGRPVPGWLRSGGKGQREAQHQQGPADPGRAMIPQRTHLIFHKITHPGRLRALYPEARSGRRGNARSVFQYVERGDFFTAKFLSILSLIPGQQLRPAGLRPEEGAVRVPGRTIQQDRNERPLALLCCVLVGRWG